MDHTISLPLEPEVEVIQLSENVSDACTDQPATDPEALLPCDIPENDEVPAKMFICSRGFSEADWNNAYATWCTAINYDEEEDDDEFDPDVDCPKMKASSENVNGYMREVDELALFEVEPDEIPSTLTGFSKNSILVGRENQEICCLDKNWHC